MSAVTIATDETLQLRLKAMHLPSFLEHYMEIVLWTSFKAHSSNLSSDGVRLEASSR